MILTIKKNRLALAEAVLVLEIKDGRAAFLRDAS